MTIQDQVGLMGEQVNQMLDRHEYDQALATVLEMTTQTQETSDQDPRPFAFCEHYLAVVIFEAFQFYVGCWGDAGQCGGDAEDSMVRWARLLPHGHEASRFARNVLPQFQPGQYMGTRYDDLAAKHDVYRTGAMMTMAQKRQSDEMISRADGLRTQREYLAAIEAYDTALNYLREIEYSDPRLEGQLHSQVGTCILNGHHYAACWAAGDEGVQMQIKQSEEQLMDKFVALMPRGIAEAYQAADMLPGDQGATKLVNLFEGVKSRAPFWFEREA